MLVSSKFVRASKSSALIAMHFKSLSTQMQVNLENAKPYHQIPGPKNAFQLLRLMGPGGKYFKMDITDVLQKMRVDYGSIFKFPGLLGQSPMVFTFLPEDIEKVHRTEGKFPRRIPLDSFHYFRTKHRPELYPAGPGLITSQGQEWYDFRSKVQQLLMQPKATKVYIPGIDSVTCEFIEK